MFVKLKCAIIFGLNRVHLGLWLFVPNKVQPGLLLSLFVVFVVGLRSRVTKRDSVPNSKKKSENPLSLFSTLYTSLIFFIHLFSSLLFPRAFSSSLFLLIPISLSLFHSLPYSSSLFLTLPFSSFLFLSLPFSSTLFHYLYLTSSLILSLPLSSTLFHYLYLSSSLILTPPLSSTLSLYLPLSSTLSPFSSSCYPSLCASFISVVPPSGATTPQHSLAACFVRPTVYTLWKCSTTCLPPFLADNPRSDRDIVRCFKPTLDGDLVLCYRGFFAVSLQ